MPNKPITARPEWKSLARERDKMNGVHMRDLFAKDKERFEKFHIELDGLLLDYSKNLVTQEIMQGLFALAQACDIAKARQDLFSGASVNVTENRPALHTALRGSGAPPQDARVYVEEMLERIRAVSEDIRSGGRWTDVVNIGIGGSEIGPRMVCAALAPFADGPRMHFLSNVDGAASGRIFKTLNPRTTLFIIVSKTFTTQETMENAQAAKAWLADNRQDQAGHFLAVTANVAAARDFGIAEKNILPLREWIGGRYSLWSAAGISIAISCGFETFRALLDGAQAMDTHFLTAPPESNMPLVMALTGVWNRNFLGMPALAVLPYSALLEEFPSYIQQIDMESNGKNAAHATGPVVFGGAGTNAQHAFMQHLHQSADITPCDFIVVAKPENGRNSHAMLLSNALAQAQALMLGRDNPREPHRHFPGNRPSNILLLDRLDARRFGMLLALYEHKIFVQGALWGINSFDQWGVELGKTLAGEILAALDGNKILADSDGSTAALISRIKKVL